MQYDPDTTRDCAPKRSFVFLQGPTSPVFRDLGRTLAARGHRVVRINLCPGDWLFWHGADTLWFRGHPDQWPAYLRQVITQYQATDIVYFADRFRYHRMAQEVARDMGVRPVSMEYGYLRPDWLILEEGGQSAYSHFPSDPGMLRRLSTPLDAIAPAQTYAIPETTEAICETSFHLSNAFLSWLVSPGYAPDRYYPVLREFASYVPRLIRRALNATSAGQTVARLKSIEAPKYLVPLQMQNDFQLRDNAPPGYQGGFIHDVMHSFRKAAPANAHLVFKLHPMDNGIERWDHVIARLAGQLGLEERVHFLDGGDLTALFASVTRCVVINSTMGLRALLAGVPTLAMGVAIYDVEGLTHQGSLDSFWTGACPPDPDLLDVFVRALAHGIHVRGTVYGAKGRAAFVQNATARLERDRLHRAGLYVAFPPRIERARRKGVAVAMQPKGA